MNKMNKLRLIKIYELKSKVHPIEASMIDFISEMEERRYSNSNIIDYIKDSSLLFSYHINTRILLIKDNSQIMDILKCPYDELKIIIKYLFEKHFKIKISIIP